jgi:predicted RNase H-like HicB family nuclease
MAVRFYPALIVQDDGDRETEGYGVVFPDFPGCVSEGDTVDEAALNATEALGGHIASMQDAGEAIPTPSAVDAPPPDWLAGASGRRVATVLVPVEVSGRVVRVNISLEASLLDRIDRVAAAEGDTRPGFLAQAARDRLANRAA